MNVRALAVLLAAPALPALAQEHAALSCPATLTVAEQPETPPGWSAASNKTSHKLKTAKIYNGKAGGEEYDLAPDDTKQHGKNLVLSWDLNGYRAMNLFVRCFYRDTEATLTADLPARLTSCSVSLEMNARNEVVAASHMDCH